MSQVLQTDFLVLGSGVAGLRAALGLAAHGGVLVATKDQPTESNTGYAQGGVAVAIGSDDDTSLHLEDTLRAGGGIASKAAGELLVGEGPERIRELASWGARFDREEGRFHMTREGAHSRRRVLHALGDATGWEILRTLLAKAQQASAIQVRSFFCSVDLIIRDGRVLGCRFLADSKGGETHVLARATLLATGGAGQVFAETTNPPVATGDGIAMAWRAGASVLDMEFVQFHPTALALPNAPRFLISEAVRGEGAHLLNSAGTRFTNELASRDRVARAIFDELRSGRGPVTLDLRHLDAERVRVRFPRIHATCQRYGIDINRDLVPVTPAAHYVMGGVATDLNGRTSLPGLYAAGEVAGSGVHGANRLASNSLLEGLVFGARAADAMVGDSSPSVVPQPRAVESPALVKVGANPLELRRRAVEALGLERNAPGLKGFLEFLNDFRRESTDSPKDRSSAETRNLADVAWVMALSALFREESRGSHFRGDFPHLDDARFCGHTLLEGDDARLADVETPLTVQARC